MTFDELWRWNLERAGAGADSVDKAVAAGLPAALDENPNELRLTADDRVFLLQVGIRPVKEPAPLEARKRRQPEIHARKLRKIRLRGRPSDTT